MSLLRMDNPALQGPIADPEQRPDAPKRLARSWGATTGPVVCGGGLGDAAKALQVSGLRQHAALLASPSCALAGVE